MNFQIKNRFSGAVIFSLETKNLKFCLEAAVESGADLGGADLRGADLRGAYLGGADLGGAKITDDTVVLQAPICIQGLEWLVTIWDSHMQIGCEFHLHNEWRDFSEEEWVRMGGKEAVKLCREHKTALLTFCDIRAAKAAKIKQAEETDNG